MAVSDIVHPDPLHPGSPAAPVHLVVEEALGDGEDPVLFLHPVDRSDIILHLLAEEAGHFDGPDALLRLWGRDHVCPVQPLVGLVDGDRAAFEVEVRRGQRQ